MKWYGHAPNASMSMHDDPELNRLLEELMRSVPINTIIETGTYMGTGSTRFLAEAFQRARGPEPGVLHTVECNYTHYVQAKQNLARYPFVKPYWGCSVSIAEAERFMASDDALVNHEHYPNIWIDDLGDPVAAYARELQGPPDPQRVGNRPEKWMGEDLLTDLLLHHLYDKPLVVLDSAGGIGWLEFQIMLRVMTGTDYYVLLDDIEHVKHFRSLAYMQGYQEGFSILGRGAKWALAAHL